MTEQITTPPSSSTTARCECENSKKKRSTLTRSDVKRIARRAGVKCMTLKTTTETNNRVRVYLRRLMGQMIPIVDESGRMTVSVQDVHYALNNIGTKVYR